MNSDKVRKEVGPAGSCEFLYMVEGRSTESHPHADNRIQERCCVRATRLLCSISNRACLLAHGCELHKLGLTASCSLQMLVVVLR